MLGFLGSHIVRLWLNCRDTAAISTAVLTAGCKPSSWSRAVRDVLGKQIYFTGVDALGLIIVIGLATGLSVVAQVQAWLLQIGQSELIGSVLVALLIREAGPLIVNFIVIGRSGTAMATELAAMNIRNEVRSLEAQGVDSLVYLVMPRAVGCALSVFGLAIFFNAVSLTTGLFMAVSRGAVGTDIVSFGTSVLANISATDIANLLLKTLLGGFLTGIICCRAGLSGGGKITDIPRAGTSGVVSSLAALIVLSALISIATYA